MQQAEQRLELARTQQGEEKYANCISNAVQAKVIGNVLLTSMGITKEQIPTVVSEKLRVAAQEIAEQDYFPVLAYSYYEYAQSLAEQDPGSALLYSEYALELANIDEYLSREEKKDTPLVLFEGIFGSSVLEKYQQEIQFVGIGLLVGLLLGSVLGLYALEKQRGKKKQ